MIHDGNLAHNFDSVECFRTKIVSLAADGANVELCADELARIFVRFLKCVAWYTANFAVEAKVTLNAKLLRSVIRCCAALPDVVFDEGMSEFFDNQLAWFKEQDTVRPAKVSQETDALKAAPKTSQETDALKATTPTPVAPNAATPTPVGPKAAAPKAVAPKAAAPKAATPPPVAESPKGFSYEDLMADIMSTM
jgi:hypothetical protein